MQKTLTGIVLLVISCCVHAQDWSATPPGTLYFTGGNVGIGNALPSALLHIGAQQGQAGTPFPSTTLLKIYQPFNTTITGASIDIGMCQPHGRITGYGNSEDNGVGQLAFSTMHDGNNYEVMRLSPWGNVGIGTSAPGYRLDVTTTNVNDGIRVNSSTGMVMLHPNSSSTWAYNGLTQAGDAGLFFGNSPATTNFGFVIAPWAYANSGIRMDKNGSVGIGTGQTSDANYKLFVETGIRTRKVVVDLAAWPDYVFHSDYLLPPLSSVAAYIRTNHHLPDMPSADSVAKSGIDLGSNQAQLLKKIEELTLYTIHQDKTIRQQAKKLEALARAVQALQRSSKPAAADNRKRK